MSRTVTLEELRTEIRELTDMDDDFVSDARLNGMIRRSVGLWHGLLTNAVPERYETSWQFTADGSAAYKVPTDYYSALAVEYQESATEWVDIPRAMFAERNLWTEGISSIAGAYRTRDKEVLLLPPPNTGTYRLIYVKRAPTLEKDTDTIDGVNGWEQWVVYDVGIQLKLKIQDPVGEYQAEREKIQALMMVAASDDNNAAPKRVVATRTRRPRDLSNRDFWVGRT